VVHILNPQDFSIIHIIEVNAIPRSLDMRLQNVLIGLSNGSIVEYDVSQKMQEVIMHSHHEGEVWGLTLIEGKGYYITSGDDNKLLMYDILSKKVVQFGIISPSDETPK
jgi:WD40 repeat protein